MTTKRRASKEVAKETTYKCMRCELVVSIEATGGFAPLCVLCGVTDGYRMTEIRTAPK